MVRGERAPRKPGPRRLNDPRSHSLVRGVANRDVRTVAEHHHEALRASVASNTLVDDDETRKRVALLLGMETWRGLSFISQKAYVTDGLELADDHWLHSITVRRDLAEATIALWYRTEAARIGAEAEGWTNVLEHKAGNRIVVELDVKKAIEALEAIGRAATPLARDNEPRKKKPRR